MKKIILAGLLAVIATTTYATVASPTVASAITATEEDNKVKVDPAALPDGVKKTLAADAYKDWKVTNAWAVKATPAYYTVELVKDDKTTTLNIDENGTVK